MCAARARASWSKPWRGSLLTSTGQSDRHASERAAGLRAAGSPAGLEWSPFSSTSRCALRDGDRRPRCRHGRPAPGIRAGHLIPSRHHHRCPGLSAAIRGLRFPVPIPWAWAPWGRHAIAARHRGRWPSRARLVTARALRARAVQTPHEVQAT